MIGAPGRLGSWKAVDARWELKIERAVGFFNFGARAPNGRIVGHTDRAEKHWNQFSTINTKQGRF